MTPTTVMKRLLRKKGVISLCRPTIFFARLVACFNTINRLMFTSQCSLLASQYLWILYIDRVKHLTLKQKYCMKLASKYQTSCKKLHLRLNTIYLKLSSKNITENKIDTRAFL